MFNLIVVLYDFALHALHSVVMYCITDHFEYTVLILFALFGDNADNGDNVKKNFYDDL